MEITKIRKGNDVRLDIQLKLNNSQDVVRIQTLRATFVNATLKDKIDLEFIKKNRFIGRFPIEPFVNEYQPTQYNINSTGHGVYRALVWNQYNGFGLSPDWEKCKPIREVDITEYVAEVLSTTNPDTKTVIFPANALLYEGVYNLIIEATLYDPGYSHNSRTVTINYDNVFELVGDSDDATNEDIVYADVDGPSSVNLRDVYMVSGYYENNSMNLTRNDGTTVNIDLSPVSGWYEGD